MTNLKKYLSLTKQNLTDHLDNPNLNNNTILNVIIGNESSDLDSNIGSIMLAYTLSVKN